MWPWWEEGARPHSSKKAVCKGGPKGTFKIDQVLNCKRLDFQAEVLKLGGVKGLQRGREHSRDVMSEILLSSNIKTCFQKTAASFPLSPCEMSLRTKSKSL